MRRWILSGSAMIVIVALVLILVPARQDVTRAAGPEMVLDLVQPLAPGGGPDLMQSGGVPVNCSTWHEIYPAFCANHHQDEYGDYNGDGQVSVCDAIKLDGQCYHITWVGPTYWTTGPGGTTVFEPLDPYDPADPVCSTWQPFFPVGLEPVHVDQWEDANGNDIVDVCDSINSGGVIYHVDRVELNIHIVPGPTLTEESTWGRIKSFLNRLIP